MKYEQPGGEPHRLEQRIMARASALFGALANPTRLRIVELLLDGERTVNDIASTLGTLQSSASQHLAILMRAGVLAVDQRGVSRFYRVRGPRIARILMLIEEFCQIHDLYGAEDLAEEEQAPFQALAAPVGAGVTTDQTLATDGAPAH